MAPRKTVEKARKEPETPGERLKRKILAEYSLDPGERVLLDQAAELVNIIARINAEVAHLESLTDRGSTRQVVPHPLLAAQRQHTETLANLLDGLRLPAPGEEEGESRTTLLARRAAEARWARERGA